MEENKSEDKQEKEEEHNETKPHEEEEHKEEEHKKKEVEEKDNKEKKDKHEEKKENKPKEHEQKSHSNEKETLTDKIRANPWIASTVVLGILVLIFLLTNLGGITGGSIMTGSVVSEADAGQSMIDWVNAQTDGQGELVEVQEFEDNFYKVTILFQGQEMPLYITKDGKYFSTALTPLVIETPSTPAPTNVIKSDKPENENIKTFYDSGEEICSEDGKPIIRMYSSSSCGYCSWSRPMYEKVINEYVKQGKIVAYLWENNDKDLLTDIDMPESEKEIFSQYNPRGGVPAFVFGCKYYRSGAPYSRDENGEQLEEQELRNVIDDLLVQ